MRSLDGDMTILYGEVQKAYKNTMVRRLPPRHHHVLGADYCPDDYRSCERGNGEG